MRTLFSFFLPLFLFFLNQRVCSYLENIICVRGHPFIQYPRV